MLRRILFAALAGALLGCSGDASPSSSPVSTAAVVSDPAGATSTAGVEGTASPVPSGPDATTAPAQGTGSAGGLDTGGEGATTGTAAGGSPAGEPGATAGGTGAAPGSGATGTGGGEQSAPSAPTAPTAASGASGSVGAERLRVRVLERYPHDPGAFTQGLLLDGGVLYESTGLEGATTLRRVDVRTGTVLASRPQASDVFGEGLALVGDELIQLSWRNGLAFVHDAGTLEPKRRFTYTGEGWGLCYDGQVLWHSDGSNTLRRRDPVTFAELGSVAVLDGGTPVNRLNELECVDGAIYANVWLTTEIVRIDAATGRVTARIDAATLVPAGLSSSDDVLNGIAYDPADGTFLLTGKRWPTLYRATFEPTG